MSHALMRQHMQTMRLYRRSRCERRLQLKTSRRAVKPLGTLHRGARESEKNVFETKTTFFAFLQGPTKAATAHHMGGRRDPGDPSGALHRGARERHAHHVSKQKRRPGHSHRSRGDSSQHFQRCHRGKEGAQRHPIFLQCPRRLCLRSRLARRVQGGAKEKSGRREERGRVESLRKRAGS